MYQNEYNLEKAMPMFLLGELQHKKNGAKVTRNCVLHVCLDEQAIPL